MIDNDHISRMEKSLREAIEKGLDKEGHRNATVKCFPTYVRELPSGYEASKYNVNCMFLCSSSKVGRFLALDLGGTNFRVVLMEIGEQGKFEMDSEIFAVPKTIMEGSGSELFDHIASCLASFIKTRGIMEEVLPLGFTFSFPCKQVIMVFSVLN